MASVLAEAGVEVAEHLTAQFPSATVERAWFPKYEAKAISGVRMVVVPMEITVDDLTRDAKQYDVRVDVAVMAHIGAKNTTEIDGHLATVQAVVDTLGTRGQAFQGDNYLYRVASISNSPALSDEHYAAHNQFTSIVSVSLRAYV